jgi:hypothetical protein
MTDALDLDALAWEIVAAAGCERCNIRCLSCRNMEATSRSFLARAVAAESEACAQIVESHWPLLTDTIAAIRARGAKPGEGA